MNERIEQLAEQAGCKVMDGEWYIPSATGLEKIVYTKGIGLEKFAELIVKECADVCQGFGESGDGYTCSYEILEHFGVEE
jgi:hypothetical protein